MTKRLLPLLLLPLSLGWVACGSPTSLSKDATTPDHAQKVDLIKISQKVRHFDCKGHFVNEEMVDTQAPRTYVSIAPKDQKNFYLLQVTNQARNRTIAMGDDSFMIDAGNGFFSMWVNNGMNKLDYTFIYCDQLALDTDGKPTGECALPTYIKETGFIYVNVNYQEQQLPDAEDHPAADQCAPPSNGGQSPTLSKRP